MKFTKITAFALSTALTRLVMCVSLALLVRRLDMHRGPWLNAVGMTSHDRERYSATIEFTGGTGRFYCFAID